MDLERFAGLGDLLRRNFREVRGLLIGNTGGGNTNVSKDIRLKLTELTIRILDAY